MSNSLPSGWARASIGSLCSLQNGRAFKPTEWRPTGLPIVRIQNLNNPAAPYNHFDGEVDERNRLRGGELLFAWSGTPGTSFGAHIWHGAHAVLNQHIFRVDFDQRLLDKRFFRFAINQKLSELIDVAHGGVGLRHVTKGVFEQTSIELPPHSEQTRIADQLDKLLARIQSCNDRLDAIPALLKRFRQAVLAVATSGRLTSDWREEQGIADGEWPIVTVGSIAETVFDGPFGSHLKSADYSDEGIRVVRLENIGALQFFADKQTFIPNSKYATLQRHTLKQDDVLFSSFVDEEVRVCIYPADEAGKAINKADVFCIRADRQLCNPSFLALRLGCKTTYVALRKQVHGATRPRINLGQIRSFEIGLPSLHEQAEIVCRVEALFQLADRIEARCAAAFAQAQRITPLLLAKAFRGELVQQDPLDEPASALRERIAAIPLANIPTSRGRPRIKPERRLPLPELKPADWASLPDGAWVAPPDPDGFATMVVVIAVLRAWGKPVPERDARLAVLFCLQPRLFAAVLPIAEAKQWSRLIGDEARPLPAQVLSFQPAINSHWGRAIKGMRARGDLVEVGTGSDITWALDAGAASIETAGWPDGRASFVSAYLRAHGADSVLPLLDTSAQEFADARAA